MLCGSHKDIFYKVILYSLHTLNTSAASVLSLEILDGHTLDISKVCHGENCIFGNDHILNIDITIVISDACSSVVAVLICGNGNLFSDYSKEKLFICKDCSELFYKFKKVGMLFLKLISFKTCKSTKSHLNYCVSLLL